MLLALATLLLFTSAVASGSALGHLRRALDGPGRVCRVPLCNTPCSGAVCATHAASTVEF